MQAGPKLLESLLQNCRGRIDDTLPRIFSLVMPKLAEVTQKKLTALRVLLYSVVASAILYSPLLTLQQLTHRQELDSALKEWMAFLHEDPTKVKMRTSDLKVNSLAVCALLAQPTAQVPPIVSSHRVTLVKANLMLLKRLDAERRRLAMQEAEESDDEDDEDEDEEDVDDDEDVPEGKDLDLDKILSSKWTDNFDDFEDDLEEEEDYHSPLDDIDENVCFSQALQAAAAEQPELLACIGLAPDGAGQLQLTEEQVGQLNEIVADARQKQAASGAVAVS